jgi:hypothetical protein
MEIRQLGGSTKFGLNSDEAVLIDQTTPQTVINGTPIFNSGIRVNSNSSFYGNIEMRGDGSTGTTLKGYKTGTVDKDGRIDFYANTASNDGAGFTFYGPAYNQSARAGSMQFVSYGQDTAIGNIEFWSYTGSAWNQRMTMLKSGNFGIGTASPTASLHVPISTILGNADSEAVTPLRLLGGKSGYYLMKLERTVGATQTFGLALTSGAYTWVDLTASGTPYVQMNGYTSGTPAPYGEARAYLAIGKTGVSDSNPGIAGQLKSCDSGLSATNGVGGNLYIEAGRGTGNAIPAKIHFLTTNAEASGTTLQTNVIRMSLVGDKFGIGSTTPTLGQLQVTDASGASANRGIVVSQHNNGVQSAVMNFYKSRGTEASPTTVATNDYTGAFTFWNRDASAYRANGGFGFKVTGAVSSNNIVGQMFFSAGSASDTDPYTNNTVRMVIGTDGLVGIGTGARTPKGALDISYGVLGLIIGGDANAFTRTNNTAKESRIAYPHYTNAEEPCAFFLASSSATENFMSIGGGSSLMNASTNIRFYTATTQTTTTGTERMRIISDGKIGIGTTTPSEALDVVGNIKASGTINGSNLSGTNTGDNATNSSSLSLNQSTPQTIFNSLGNTLIMNSSELTFSQPTDTSPYFGQSITSMNPSADMYYGLYTGGSASPATTQLYSTADDSYAPYTSGVFTTDARGLAFSATAGKVMFQSAGVTAWTFDTSQNMISGTDGTSAHNITTAGTITCANLAGKDSENNIIANQVFS